MVQPLATEDPPRLGPFELTGRIGEGAQGVVYLGRGPGDERVAVKLLHHGLAADPEARTRFLREVAVARRVARFCTAPVLHADLAGSRPYIVSEYVPGPSLRQLVEQEGPRRGAALERLAISTATALSAIHRAGVLHRDFKPANVLMGPEGPVVIDFGIAKALDTPGTTATGMALGTPSYLAPEQLGAGEVTAASDVFAWGVTMVFAATGRPAFGADSIPAVMQRILNGEPDLDELEGQLRHLVTASLAKDPARRPTASELVDHLMNATLPSPREHPAPVPGPARHGRASRTAPGPGGRPRRPRGLLLAGVAGGAVLAVTAGTVVVVQSGENASSARAAAPAPATPPLSEAALEPAPGSSPASRRPARSHPERQGGSAPVVRDTGRPATGASPGPARSPGEDSGGSPPPAEPTTTVPSSDGPTTGPTTGPTVKPTPPPTVRPTAKPTVKPTVAPTVKPPPPRPNPYTATGVCGPGYRVIGSKGLGGATVYLLYSTAEGKNCVVTLSKYVVPGKLRMSATLRVQNGPSAADSGVFTAYAGPVRLVAAKKCVIWGGVYGASAWKSGWGNCA
ncbi:hypothetical protein GCM10017673_05580 [Streptosporangium violaceochromogenes]|nr:hypothetical protein GCM10017673_05580 [Streptosporangium violaceochromogenes]